MDINCTYNCAHQKDGKCLLSEIPNTLSMVSATDKTECGDCLYFEKKK